MAPTSTNIRLVPVVIIKSPPGDNPPGLDPSSGSGSDSEDDLDTTPISPSMQAKIDVFDPEAQSSKFFRKPPSSEKRKASESPELSKIEKKALKKEKKRLKKIEHKRLEHEKLLC